MGGVASRLGVPGGRFIGLLLVLVLAGPFVAAAVAQNAPSGVDVSHWQGQIDWIGVAGDGHTFAFEKATEGTTFTDVTYPLNREGANAVGIKIGAYHYARPAGGTSAAIAASAIAQADAFLAYAQPAPGDLLPALDLEETGGLSVPDLTTWTQSWLDEVAVRLGVRPIVYASPDFWKRYLGDTPILAADGDPLWIAHWTAAALPILPGGAWGGFGWMFWQWSNCEHVTGIARCVDGDRFNGTSLAAATIPPSPSGLPVSTASPMIEGTPQAGKLLAALPGAWGGGKPATLSYQWQSCLSAGSGCLPIAGATGETYSPAAPDVGHALSVLVTAQSPAGSSTAGSAPTLAVASSVTPSTSTPTPTSTPAPAPTSPPTITGTLQVGQTLAGQVGKWKGANVTFSYQWRRCAGTAAVCTAIDGAGGATYTLTPGEIGSAISLVVTATGPGGSRSATSAASGVVISAPVPAPVVGSSPAAPGLAGAVSVSDGTAVATWQPGTVTLSSLITLGPTPSRLALPASSLSLGVTSPAPLPWPVDLRYAAAPPDAVPGFLPGSGVWQPVSQLPGPTLPDGQNFGAYRDPAGALHVLTRSPGRIALFAPGKWGDPRFASSHAPNLALIDDFTLTRRPDGAALIRGRVTLDTQAHLYVSLITPHGRALIPQQGSRVGWWLTGLPTQTIQTLQLRPGAFPIRLVVPAGQTGAKGRYSLRLAAIDPYGRHAQFVVTIPQLGAGTP